ncbi:hypothetical protein KAF25_003955 [Fusarium avenaceum]|uniref:Uncharacterized protein n=1 Tax=Fusarium avenaceum TaxID=40199 RepID=A0A9P7KME4_9HYPO|nr:hypothetical protein KAF25_003955 [Fusarium avenaceum]
MAHLWWAAKRAAVQMADLSIKGVRRILRSDSALSALESVLVVPLRARFVALFYFVLRLGPPFRFSLLLSGYTVQCDQLGKTYPWSFRVHTNIERLVGGAALALALPFLYSLILVLHSRNVDAVPRSTLAVTASLFGVIQPLQNRRFRAVRSDIDGQIILDVAPCEPHDQTFSYPGARTALNIPVILYGICAGAAFEQMVDLYRCFVFHYNPVDLIQLENLFQGHFLFSYWRLRQLPVLGGRAFTDLG